MAASDPTMDVPTPTGTLQGVAAFSWDGTAWQPSGRAGPSVATSTGVLQGVAAFNGGPAWQPAGRAQPGVATPTGVLDGVAVYTWSGSAWTPPGGTAAPSTPSGALRGVAAFNWDGAAWQPAGQAGPRVATPYGVLDGVAMFGWTGSVWAATGGPSLSLDFMAPGTLDPRITFARTSTATYFNSSGVMQTAAANAPRWDYDPVTHAVRGLLVEEQRQNVIINSTDFSGWPVADIVVAGNAGIAPDGSNTMTRLAESATSTLHYMDVNCAVTSGALYTFSLFAKAQQNRYIQLFSDDNGANGAYATFDVQAGVISGPLTARGTGTIGTATITPVGNGVYRCSMASSIPITVTRTGIVMVNTPNPGFAIGYAGNAANGLLVWGSQFEAGAFPTSYIPTTGAAVTRSADFTTMPWTMTPAFSFTYEGLSQPPLVTAQIVFDDGAGANFVRFYSAANSNMHYNVSGGSDVVVGNIGTTSIYKAAGTFISGAQTSALNGTLGPTASAVTLPPGLTTLRLGSWFDGTLHNTTWLRGVRYWPRVLSNAELQSVTT